jgi:dTDP-4-dehydrorhamnose 3,5-epimerase
MEFIKGQIEGLFIIESKVFSDHRGHFFESFHESKFAEATGFHKSFVQDNESLSVRNVIRGLHFQAPPHAQAKLVRVIKGEVIDVAIDIRRNSPTYGKFQAIHLTAANKRMFFIPEGFAHGFAALTDEVVFQYKCSEYYCPESERGILATDRNLGIDWGVSTPILSQKDLELGNFSNFESPFY